MLTLTVDFINDAAALYFMCYIAVIVKEEVAQCWQEMCTAYRSVFPNSFMITT